MWCDLTNYGNLRAYIYYGEAILMLRQVKHRVRCLASERPHKIVACKGASTSAREHKRGRPRRGIREHMP